MINHVGYKLNITSRTYNKTVTHWRRVLGTTSGHPATWNDKSIILYDDLVRGVHEGKLFDYHNFSLLKYYASGNIVVIKYQAVWIMVDNGYLYWSTTIPKMKKLSHTNTLYFLNGSSLYGKMLSELSAL